jgi:hypothetical protein
LAIVCSTTGVCVGQVGTGNEVIGIVREIGICLFEFIGVPLDKDKLCSGRTKSFYERAAQIAGRASDDDNLIGKIEHENSFDLSLHDYPASFDYAGHRLF